MTMRAERKVRKKTDAKLSRKLTIVRVRVNNRLERKRCATRLPIGLKQKWEHAALASVAISDVEASETYDKLGPMKKC